MRILLVEDDPMIAEAVEGALSDELHAVHRVANGLNAMAQLAVNDYQLVLLDLGLPGADGLSVLSRIRAQKNDVPVIILTARDGLEDRLAGLNGGADDYIVKPFHMAELLARIQAVMRRRNGSAAADDVLTNGVVAVDRKTKTASLAENPGAAIALTRREYALLCALLSRPGTILSRRALEDRIYEPGEEPESNAVEFILHSLRKKLGSRSIKNVRGLGWMMPKAAEAAACAKPGA